LVARKFADAGNFVEVFTYEKGAHAFDLKDRSPEAATMMAKTLDFFSNYLR
jgi:acetyl esterase/lipase